MWKGSWTGSLKRWTLILVCKQQVLLAFGELLRLEFHLRNEGGIPEGSIQTMMH